MNIDSYLQDFYYNYKMKIFLKVGQRVIVDCGMQYFSHGTLINVPSNFDDDHVYVQWDDNIWQPSIVHVNQVKAIPKLRSMESRVKWKKIVFVSFI